MPDPVNEFPKSTTHCPSLEQLDRYYSGQLSAEEVAVVRQHLSQCAACAAALEAATVAETPRSTPRPQQTPRSTGWTPSQLPRLTGEAPVVFAEKYCLIRKIAEGGMGVVYEAREEPLHRAVALKLVRCGWLAGEAAIQRFRTEAQAVARLEHPHIVPIYDYGEFDGAPYFSMELLAGGSLAEKLEKQKTLPEREAAQLVETLARAVQFAHEHHVLHRDLKPGNVLLTADGTVKLSDFGLAKLLDADSGQTYSDAVLGTPSYMSPEQASGDTRKVDVGSDVYSLGAILYELLTGHPPFRGHTRAETLDMVRATPPRAPGAVCKGLTPALEAICLKCLEKEPGDRYASAGELAEQLRSFLDGKTLPERARTRPATAWRMLRRRRLPIVGVALLVLVGVAVLLAGFSFKTPAPVPKPEPPRTIIEKQIGKGRAYEYKGTEELPGPWLWFGPKNGQQIAAPKDECFKIESNGVALLELVADPGCERYRFSVELRHDDAEGMSHLGVYFGGRAIGPAGSPTFLSYYSFTFGDREGAKGATEYLGTAKIRYCCAPPEDVIVPAIQIGAVVRFQAAKPLGKRSLWRTISVEVTPEGVRAVGPDGNIAKALWVSAENICQSQSNLAAVEPKQATNPVEFRPRASVGLILVRGEAAFRHIILEPLPEKK